MQSKLGVHSGRGDSREGKKTRDTINNKQGSPKIGVAISEHTPRHYFDGDLECKDHEQDEFCPEKNAASGGASVIEGIKSGQYYTIHPNTKENKILKRWRLADIVAETLNCVWEGPLGVKGVFFPSDTAFSLDEAMNVLRFLHKGI